MSSAKIEKGLKAATASNVASVTIEGQRWARVSGDSVIMPRTLTAGMIDAAETAMSEMEVGEPGDYDWAALYRAFVGARPVIPT